MVKSLSGFRRTALALGSVGLVAIFGLGGCGDDDNPANPGGGGGPTQTQLTGGFIGGGDGGKLTLTVATGTLAPPRPGLRAGAVDVGATGTLDLDGGGLVSLSGTYDTVTDSLNLSDGLPGGYAFVGVYDTTGADPGIIGGYTGPNGNGLWGCFVGTESTVKVFCGSFENAGMTVSGRWSLIIIADRLIGGMVATGSSDIIGFEGTVTGSSNPRILSMAGEEAGVELTGAGAWDTTTNDLSGTWSTSDSGTQAPIDNGTWASTLCQ